MSQPAGYRLLAEHQNMRAARLYAVEVRLAKHLPQEDTQRVALQHAREAANELARMAEVRVARLESWPETGEDDWVVAGNVSNADGTPAKGVTIRVYDKDRKYDDLLGETETNKFGDFSIVYDTCDFQDAFSDDEPDLFVMVTNRQGRELIEVKTPVRYNAGRIEHFDIRLT